MRQRVVDRKVLVEQWIVEQVGAREGVEVCKAAHLHRKEALARS
jgi:hypothetical protein